MAISASVPQIPIERVRTSTDPSEVSGSGRSMRPAVSGCPGTIDGFHSITLLDDPIV
jgi:hypothetical protein